MLMVLMVVVAVAVAVAVAAAVAAVVVVVVLPAALQAGGRPHNGCKISGLAILTFIAAGGRAVLSFGAVLRGMVVTLR